MAESGRREFLAIIDDAFKTLTRDLQKTLGDNPKTKEYTNEIAIITELNKISENIDNTIKRSIISNNTKDIYLEKQDGNYEKKITAAKQTEIEGYKTQTLANLDEGMTDAIKYDVATGKGKPNNIDDIQKRIDNCSTLEKLYLRKHDELMTTFAFSVNLFSKYKYAVKVMLFLLNSIVEHTENSSRDERGSLGGPSNSYGFSPGYGDMGGLRSSSSLYSGRGPCDTNDKNVRNKVLNNLTSDEIDYLKKIICPPIPPIIIPKPVIESVGDLIDAQNTMSTVVKTMDDEVKSQNSKIGPMSNLVRVFNFPVRGHIQPEVEPPAASSSSLLEPKLGNIIPSGTGPGPGPGK